MTTAALLLSAAIFLPFIGWAIVLAGEEVRELKRINARFDAKLAALRQR